MDFKTLLRRLCLMPPTATEAFPHTHAHPERHTRRFSTSWTWEQTSSSSSGCCWCWAVKGSGAALCLRPAFATATVCLLPACSAHRGVLSSCYPAWQSFGLENANRVAVAVAFAFAVELLLALVSVLGVISILVRRFPWLNSRRSSLSLSLLPLLLPAISTGKSSGRRRK